MKTILIQTASPFSANNALFDQDQNNMTQMWRELKKRLAPLGYDVRTADNNSLDDCAWILFLDTMSLDGWNRNRGLKGALRQLIKKIKKTPERLPWPNRPLYQEALKRDLQDRMALFLWEGAIISPNNYTPEIWKKFKIIFTWKDDLVDNKKFFKFYLPTPLQPKTWTTVPFSGKKLLVNISSNKWYRGRHELFSARAKTSKYFDTHYPNDFDLFGTRWQVPITRWQRYFPWLIKKFNCYRGTTPDKMVTISKYKFALCYENVSDNQGYVTEKIFDILQAGTVPIYWGAPNVEQYVDPKAFVDRRKFKDDAALATCLKNMTEAEYEKMLAAGATYLQSDQCKKFLPEYFCDRIIEVLKV